MKDDSSQRRSRSKSKAPKKPRTDFPLSIHKGTGYWCKKIKGRVFYFDKVEDDPKGTAVLEEWERVREDLCAGREPRAKSGDELTIADLCNVFLSHKKQLRVNGELSPRTFREYFDSCEVVVKAFSRNRSVVDLSPDDFRKLRKVLSKDRGPVSLHNPMQQVRSLFYFGFDDGLLLVPVRFGQGFKKPSLDTVRRDREAHRSEHGDRMFDAHEIRKVLAKSSQPLRSMILIAANGGQGQADLAAIPIRGIDLENGWLNFACPSGKPA